MTVSFISNALFDLRRCQPCFLLSLICKLCHFDTNQINHSAYKRDGFTIPKAHLAAYHDKNRFLQRQKMTQIYQHWNISEGSPLISFQSFFRGHGHYDLISQIGGCWFLILCSAEIIFVWTIFKITFWITFFLWLCRTENFETLASFHFTSKRQRKMNKILIFSWR